ncbi:MAG: hypothetical protein PUI85_01600 [Eubacteriales bacterium]|nr:hypothetical protein [Eubacteriales bacterium]
MWIFKILLVIMLCLPIGYILLFFCSKLKDDVSMENMKDIEKVKYRKRREDAKRNFYNDRRPRRRW